MTAAGVAQQSIGVSNGGGIGTRAVNSESSSPTPADRLKLSDMALEALANVMKHNKGLYTFNRTITVSSTSKNRSDPYNLYTNIPVIQTLFYRC